jgi:hypothetical protein
VPARGDANFARTQQCEAWRFIFGDGARARAATRTLPARNNAKRGVLFLEIVREPARRRELCPHATMRSVADSGNIMEISWKYPGYTTTSDTSLGELCPHATIPNDVVTTFPEFSRNNFTK